MDASGSGDNGKYCGKTLRKPDNADEKAEREAREVLPSVMGSDIWEAMLDEFEGARKRVARLMDNHNV